MTFAEYKESGYLADEELREPSQGGYRRCRYCGREIMVENDIYDEKEGYRCSKQEFCCEDHRRKFWQRVEQQKMIESGRPPQSIGGKIYCPYGERCEHCPEDDCIANVFVFSVAYQY